MATEQGFVGRGVSQLINWLAVPRAASWPVLLLVGIGGGQLLWSLVDSVKILSWVAGMAAPFCMMCATAVWAMRDRIDDAFDVDHMSAQQYKKAVSLCAQHRARSTFWAGVTAMMALLSSAPAVSNQLIGPIWHWMLLALGGAVGTAVYAYQLASFWDHQIRAYKSEQRMLLKTKHEKQELLDVLTSSLGEGVGTGWTDGPALTVRH